MPPVLAIYANDTRKRDQMLGAPTPTPRAHKSQPAPPAPLRLPFTDYDSHNDWTNKTLPGIRALDNYTPPIDPVRAQQLRHVDALAAMAGIKSPSPDSVEDEDAQLALGIRMSLAQFNSTSGAGGALLSTLLPNPMFSIGLVVSESGRLSRELPSSCAPSVPLIIPQGHSQFHCGALAYGRRGAQAFLINNVPSWPVWQASEATGSLTSRLSNGAVLDLLHPKFKKWVDMDLDHVHQLTPDCVVMFRRRGLDCINFEDTKDSFYPPNVNIHIRDNLPGERATLRRLYSIKHRLPEAPRTPGSAAEDSDVEIVGEKRTRVKQENFEDLLAPRRQRPRLRIDTDKCIVIDDDIDTPTLTTASSLPSSVPSSSAPSPTFSSAPSPSLSSTSPTISWPTSEFVIDMIAGFKRMECQDFKGLARHDRFERAFKRPYITSTVSEQKAIYAAATEEEVQKGVDAGRSKDGLWSVWRKKHGLAARIAARRGHAA
ncbi:hypothetical protein B0H14DRAFT_3458369 [Mycena olivaceomarginata]|nr:hypothetical protein B0H14DRAFT_3458369 [Mycena olivaceomarginata]